MKKIIKKVIIILILIFIVLAAIIYIKIINIKKGNKEEVIADEQPIIENIEPEESVFEYIYSNTIIKNVLNYIAEEEKNVDNEEVLISLLDEEYKNKYNINKNNVIKILSDYKGIKSYSSKEIYKQEINQMQNTNGIYLYVKGITRKNGIEKEIYTLIKKDLLKSTYSITFLNETEFNNAQNSKEISINPNIYNSINNEKITDYKICLTYLNDYLDTIQNNPKDGYKLLNKEYRESRFKSQENYVEYLKQISNRISSTVLKSYAIEEQDGKIQYICIDQRNNYYIFEKGKMMDYTVILDTYTQELPQFVKKYNDSNNIQKVGYNVQKCIEAINNKDYKYVYNKLDTTFKNEKYSTEDYFEKTIKNQLFDNNIIKNASASNEGNIYIYKVTIQDALNDNNKKNVTFIMQLKENIDYVISFSLQN